MEIERTPPEARPGWPRLVWRGLVLLAINALGVYIGALILPGVGLEGNGALIAVVLIAALNAALWPTLARFLLPVSALTLGVGSLILSGAMIYVAGQITSDFRVDGIGWGILLSIIVTIVNVVTTTLLGVDDDNLWWHRAVKRAAQRGGVEPTDVPGVLFLEIDGLAHDVLQRAMRNGHAPTLTRWLEEGTHRLVPWECDWSSQTGASQAGLLHGCNDDMPAFRWFEKERGVAMVSNHARNTAEIQHRISDGNGLLAGDGVSRANMFSGDAPHTLLTLSTITERGRGPLGRDYYAYFANPYGLTRTLVLIVADMIREKWAALTVRRRDVKPRVHRGGLYPLVRAWTTVAQRDLAITSLLSDVYAGRPVGYSTFVGYDEIAHHSGIERHETLRALEQLDHQFARLESAARDAPRPYRFVVLSDHGQTDGTPFRQRTGETLEALVDRLTDEARIEASSQGDEGWAMLGASMTEAAGSEGAAAGALRRVTAKRVEDGVVAVGPEASEERKRRRRLRREQPPPPEVLVMASGCLGLVYFTTLPGRASLETITGRHPRLIQGLLDCPDIGFLLVRSEKDGSLVLGRRGTLFLDDDRVEGEDPLAPFGPNAIRHVRRTDGFRHVADIMINSAYDTERGMVPAFEEFVGSHGGLGGTQGHPFALIPRDWPVPDDPIVGAEAMHRLMVDWLIDLGQERPRATVREAPGAPVQGTPEGG
jgi:uncharacterized membrane protein YvlD (DUF360 family)